jgi:hypothetical protein
VLRNPEAARHGHHELDLLLRPLRAVRCVQVCVEVRSIKTQGKSDLE